jgi:hypothetical protein
MIFSGFSDLAVRRVGSGFISLWSRDDSLIKNSATDH